MPSISHAGSFTISASIEERLFAGDEQKMEKKLAFHCRHHIHCRTTALVHIADDNRWATIAAEAFVGIPTPNDTWIQLIGS